LESGHFGWGIGQHWEPLGRSILAGEQQGEKAQQDGNPSCPLRFAPMCERQAVSRLGALVAEMRLSKASADRCNRPPAGSVNPTYAARRKSAVYRLCCTQKIDK